MKAADLDAVLGNWHSRKGPLYVRLSGAIADGMLRGDVGAPTPLPAERDLARQLQVSRNTIAAAYQVLRERGLAQSVRGSGTSTARGMAGGIALPPVLTPSLGLIDDPPTGVIDCFGGGLPDLGGVIANHLPVTHREAQTLARSLHYEPLGSPELRSAIADRFARSGTPTHRDEVLVTSGAQQAIDLLFRLFARDGGSLVIENPTYVGAIDAARAAGLSIVAVRVGHRGIDLDDARQKLRRPGIAALYVTTRCHNPTGAVMSATARADLFELAVAAGVAVIDDATLADLDFSSAPDSGAIEVPANGIVIGSVSKVFWSGLRVGWVRAPTAVIDRLARMKFVADLGTSRVSQLIATRVIRDIDRVSESRRVTLMERAMVFSNAMASRLPDWRFDQPRGGPFAWVRLPRGSADHFADVALQHGVHVLAGTRLSVDASTSDHLRISFVADPDVLRAAVDRLAAAWAIFGEPHGRLRRSDDVVV